MNTIIQKIKKKLNNLFIDLDLSNQSTLFITAMGRSGTTWLSNLINYNDKYRDIFEPFIPYKVKEAEQFKYLQYLNPENRDTDLINHAKKILSGKFRSGWTDSTVQNHFFTKRIIKDIRTNLMISWLIKLRPKMPIIMLIRSPYSVINSYKELGWGVEAGGEKSDFERIISQKELLQDFPKMSSVLNLISQKNYIDQLAFLWCVLYYVPIQQLSHSDYLLVYYEDLLLKPESTLKTIFNYLKQPLDLASLMEIIDKPSVTNYRQIDFKTDKNQLIEKWKNSLSESEIIKINDIINHFKLNHLYDKDGYPLKR